MQRCPNQASNAPLTSSLIVALRNPNPAICEFFGDAIARHRIDVCWVRDRFSDFTPLRNVTVGGVTACFLAEHTEQEEKEETD